MCCENLSVLPRYVYKRKHPERRLQTNFWIPYIDDSESWYYEAIFITEFYLIYWIIVVGTVTMTAIPVILIHLFGQYTILCQSIVKLAKERRDDGKYVYYTNFEKGKYVVSDKPMCRMKREEYEQNYCHQLIRFHQKLIKFQDEVCVS